MVLADVVIPVAPYHLDKAQRAIQSAKQQSVPVTVTVQVDNDLHGTGWARNKGAAQGDAPFVVFLDADDELHPDFVKQCALAYRQGVFVYSDWQLPAGEIIRLPDCTTARGWLQHKVFHLVTTLMPRALFQQVGGFDETLPGLEDMDFYLRLHSKGICGIRCAQSLVTYHTDDGQRSQRVMDSGQYAPLRASIAGRYERNASMGCCGDPIPMELPPPDGRAEGDVLAVSLWEGNRDQRGAVSGRRYRGGWQREIWIDPRDLGTKDSVTGQPAFVQIIPLEQLAPDVDTVLRLAGAS
jgi:hypothetical protein